MSQPLDGELSSEALQAELQRAQQVLREVSLSVYPRETPEGMGAFAMSGYVQSILATARADALQDVLLSMATGRIEAGADMNRYIAEATLAAFRRMSSALQAQLEKKSGLIVPTRMGNPN